MDTNWIWALTVLGLVVWVWQLAFGRDRIDDLQLVERRRVAWKRGEDARLSEAVLDQLDRVTRNLER